MLDYMSYVDVVILSHPAKEPSHGYELRRRVEAATGFALHNNSLSPALRRFEEAGAVTKTAQPQEGGRPPRHVYAITEVGREMLHDMLTDLPPAQAGDEAEFLARLGQFELLMPAERCAVLDARLAALSTRAAHLAHLANASPPGRASRAACAGPAAPAGGARGWRAGGPAALPPSAAGWRGCAPSAASCPHPRRDHSHDNFDRESRPHHGHRPAPREAWRLGTVRAAGWAAVVDAG